MTRGMFCRSAALCRRPRTPAEPPRHTPTPVPRACSVTRRNTALPMPPQGPRRTRRRARLQCRAAGLLQLRPRPRRHCRCITQRFMHPNQPTALRACTCQGTDEEGLSRRLASRLGWAWRTFTRCHCWRVAWRHAISGAGAARHESLVIAKEQLNNSAGFASEGRACWENSGLHTRR